MIKRNSTEGRGWVRETGQLVVVALALLVGGCEVTNPGPVQDDFLNLPDSHDALVTGAERMLVEAMNEVAYTGAVVAHEIFPGGATTGGHTPLIQGGSLIPEETNDYWNLTQRARFIGEDAVRRFTTVAESVDPNTLARAYVWAGYANRLLGENWCQVAFDGGSAEDPDVALERAEQNFTDALAVVTDGDLESAAYAGRAQVRLLLGDWAGADSDAAMVPTDFVLTVDADGGDTDTRNNIYWGNANLPYRQFTMHFTYYYDYYTDTGDPRVAWEEDPEFPLANASLQGFGQVPWSRPLKYNSTDADYRMASGREMRLVQAEALLRNSNFVDAMPLINGIRTAVESDIDGDPLDPWTAANIDEAWTALMRERAIELHMEARRLADLERWEDGAVPGDIELADFGAQSTLFTQFPDARCFPIPESEINTNTNISGS